MAAPPGQVEVIELWRLPLDFYQRSLDEQWKALAEVRRPALANRGKRQPCPMAAGEQLELILWTLFAFGLPLSIVPVSIVLAVSARWALKYWVASLAVLALHPLPKFSLQARRSRLGLIMARYFTIDAMVDMRHPVLKHMFTPEVDKQVRDKLPIANLACPHGVLNFGAIVYVFLNRWGGGAEQYTAGAKVVQYVPGLRHFVTPLWVVNVDKKSLVRSFRERPTSSRPRGGLIGIVPDGISGIFHSTPGTDVLHIGKKRGLMRLALEEGVSFCAVWFSGTSDCFTIVQDPFGAMKWISRKLSVSVFLVLGRWGLPIPRRSPTTMFAHWEPAEKVDSPTSEQIEALHQRVYGGLVSTFDDLKGYAGLSDRTLLIT